MNKYDDDFFEWTQEQAEFIKNKEFEKLDIINLQDEIESMGNSEKRALRSQMSRLLMHLLKKRYQPEKDYSSSWQDSISDAEIQLQYLLEDSPSLMNRLKEIYPDCYKDAKRMACKETGLN